MWNLLDILPPSPLLLHSDSSSSSSSAAVILQQAQEEGDEDEAAVVAEDTNVELSLEEKFFKAKEFIAHGNSSLLQNISDHEKLRIYALYKQATVGDVKGSQPSMFNVGARAKYDAWAMHKSKSKDDAMLEYIENLAHLDPSFQALIGTNKNPSFVEDIHDEKEMETSVSLQEARMKIITTHQDNSLSQGNEDYAILKEKYERLLRDHNALINKAESEIITTEAEHSTYKRYLKVAILWTFTSVVLFAIAEHQLKLHRAKVLYGSLLTVGGSLFVFAIPMTHIVGEYLYRTPSKAHSNLTFFVFRLLSWSFYMFAVILIAASVYYAGEEHGLLLFSGIIAVIAQTFMVSSLLTLEEPRDNSHSASSSHHHHHPATTSTVNHNTTTVTAILKDGNESSSLQNFEIGDISVGRERTLSDSQFSALSSSSASEIYQLEESSNDQYDDHRQRLATSRIGTSSSDDEVLAQFTKMNFAIIVISVVLAFIAEHSTSPDFGIAAASLSLVCGIIGITLTHGLLGKVKNKHKGWKFSQMFEGGRNFVMVQIFAWSAFGFAVLVIGSAIVASIFLGRRFVEGSMYIGGISLVLAEALLLFSLSIYKGKLELANEQLERDIKIHEEKYDKTKDPHCYRALPEYSLSEAFMIMTSVSLFTNLQYTSFFVYLIIFQLPFLLPKWSVFSFLTLNIIPDLTLHSSYSVFDAFNVWVSFFAAIGVWVFIFSSMRTIRATGWASNLILSISAVLLFGLTLRLNWNSPGCNCLIVLISANLVYMATTYPTSPEVNGSRQWDAFRRLDWLFETFEVYFGLQIVMTPEMQAISKEIGSLDATDYRLRQCIFGFHPHGILPITHVYLSSSSTFRKSFPHLHARVRPMVASIIHLVPVMRDIAQWCGVVDVAHDTMKLMLESGENVQLVIGGQTEMFESKSYGKKIVLVRKKRTGIFKIAIKHGCSIVPMFCFGETLLMDNIYLPTIQAWFKSWLGIPVPFFPYGRWYFPVPRRRPVTVAFAAPVHPIRQHTHPTKEEIIEFQSRYFQALEDLFENFKHECGHGDHKIEWQDT